ncbi:hypothetical protein [uncultured Sunxiuqinia sp.]|nr:hypothetical protein [uncultured Sunxiuqinia sp.]
MNKEDGSVVLETAIDGNTNTYCSSRLIEHNGNTLATVNLNFNLIVI